MAQVTIIVGSASDRPVIDPAIEILRGFKIEVGLHVASAHRDPARVARIVADSEKRGTQVFIAAAGMAAHLAGMVASHTVKPVIGLPIGSGPFSGQDSLLSTVMMPAGVPVATVAVDGGKNAAWLALEILALLPGNEEIAKGLNEERTRAHRDLADAEKKWLKEIRL
jgi:5-(carboxyamino)imidazole ribonucleotide mutase